MTLNDFALAIEAAKDVGDEETLRHLSKECKQKLETATAEERVNLLYFRSNIYYGAIDEAEKRNNDTIWNWEQPGSLKCILLLRLAINEPAFNTIDSIRACQIRTNLASQLSTMGRLVAANAEWSTVLETNPFFAKALASQAQALRYYAELIYDPNHRLILLASARNLFDRALDENAIWESGDRDYFAPGLMEERELIADILTHSCYDDEYDLNQWSLGRTEEERAYRQWCLQERLFLNPLNEVTTESTAARDVLHLPDHTYGLRESPRFPLYFNLLKETLIKSWR